ncbi:MAG: hypothetical protein ACRDZY_02720 [Acidimicrobiales bacterium]
MNTTPGNTTLVERLNALDRTDPNTAALTRRTITEALASGRFNAELAQLLSGQVGELVLHPMVRVQVFHNLALCGIADGYQHGDPLVEVECWMMEPPVCDRRDETLLEQVYHLLNVGEDPAFGVPDRRAIRYRLRRNRSLSVGDVARVAGRWWAVAGIGWMSIPEPQLLVTVTMHGTTPVDV